jgi:Chaperone for flagella basal body P-ring formation
MISVLERRPNHATAAPGPNSRTGHPTGRRTRRPALVLASVVLVFASIAGFAELYSSANHQTSVLIVTQTIDQGQRISGSDLGLTSAQISGGVNPIAAADTSALVGQRAAVTIPAGTLLTEGDITNSPPITEGDAVVGLELKAGQLPASGLEPGDQVMIIQTANPGTPLSSPNSTADAGSDSGQSAGVLVPLASVFDVESPSPNSSPNASLLVSVEVSSTVAAGVSMAANADQVSLVLLPPTSGRPNT